MVLLSESLSRKPGRRLYAGGHVCMLTQGQFCVSPQAACAHETQKSHQWLCPAILMLTDAAQIHVQQPRASGGEEGSGGWDEGRAGEGAGVNGISQMCQCGDSLLSLRHCVSFLLHKLHSHGMSLNKAKTGPAGEVRMWPGQAGFRACTFQSPSGTSTHHMGSGLPDWHRFESTVQQKFSSDSLTQEGGCQGDQTRELREYAELFTPPLPFPNFDH